MSRTDCSCAKCRINKGDTIIYESYEYCEGAFDVSTWRATQKDYTVTDKISYKVGYEQGTEYDKLDTLEELISTKDQEFYNKVNNNSQDLLKPVCQTIYAYRHNGGSYIESVNTNNIEKPGFAALKAEKQPLKGLLLRFLCVFLSKNGI